MRTTQWFSRALTGTLLLLGFRGCGEQESRPHASQTAGNAGWLHGAGASGAAEQRENAAGASGTLSDPSEGGAAASNDAGGAAGDFDTAGAAGVAGATGAAGARDWSSLPELVEVGHSTVSQVPRSSYGALLATSDGERSYVVESRRDVEPGPFGLPWRSRFRLAAYDHGELAWAFNADADDLIGDVVVHPSGELTLSLERRAPERNADELVRLSRDGHLLHRAPLASPRTVPVSDYGSQDPQPLFAMKSALADATTAGWVRLLPEAEGVVVAFLSFVASPGDAPLSQRMALGLELLDWREQNYEERWARVVEGSSFAEPTAWAYDEFRWTEQAIRPFLARDPSNGDLWVGRAWNQTRCQANAAVFAEVTHMDCVLRAPGAQENELLPLAVTRFDASGIRKGTRILWPDSDAAEQVAFALAAREGKLAVAGAVVRSLSDGSKKTYPDPSGYVDYDGYIAIYDAEGHQLEHHDYDFGRGDVLAGLRWADTGIVAVGAAGWDRWQGGMSITRGSSPFFAWLSQDGADARSRLIPLSDGSRHWNLHDVLVRPSQIVGYGFADAPMTHSADGGKTEQRSFGALRIELD